VSKAYRDLFKGTAPYYARYRYKYAPAFFGELIARLNLNGAGRLLDLGCGTGQLTLPLAAYFEEAVGLDPEPEMLEQAALAAEEAGVKNVRWVEGGSADLPALKDSLGSFRVVTMGNSFHWMDQATTLAQLDRMVDPGGALAIMGTSSGGIIFEATEGWAYEIRKIVQKVLGETRRAGTSTYQMHSLTFEEALDQSPFSRVEIFEMDDTRYLTADEIIGFLYSTSYASKAVLGDKQAEFEREVRQTLHKLNPAGQFADHINTGAFLARRPS
jgi:ubiquinone/menaquinone biosynthesis C-methylase UbiE